ncbi:MAG TPA: DUF2520 domain-containing protein [Sphingobium sp.]|jgi:predicted short-subunit dehydrogenase-like oxidoreductase (DUF2520 family)|uniref:Rossmann-like and DUF2520 domain-containing protein n=1 Tax=unclassified Sphingobium TaxID=2611147 RepID=UPI0007F329CF|nr:MULTISPECIES: Rossmann-like and DUF2520 domain-containing protein [unclassified Sphingobium]OAN59305.1 cytoplasmic protein [Sphingobium sp. TCM1]WIW90082.1 DUF2520 domain-containing protein [Sphingobium sp. V4]HAF42196.1 DUF2520 domain-containing protein [Sphingobium sp.]
MSHFPYRQIGIIGTGRVARALALALQRHSAAPILLWGRNRAALSAMAREIGRATAATDTQEMLQGCDLIGVAVSDDAIGDIVATLSPGPMVSPSPLLFHVSGRSGVGLMEPLLARGVDTAAIHPAMTFTGDASTEVQRMAGAHFAVTGSSDHARDEAHRLVSLLGGVAVDVREEHRALYHAALCHAANHLVTLIAGACRALQAAGAGDPLALLGPLLRAAMENSLAHGFDALSGPLLRGDGETIATHLAALASDCPSLAPAYRAMALATLDELERCGDASSATLRRLLD